MSQVPDLSVEIAGIRFSNPVFAASGTFGYGEEFAAFVDLNEVGAVCIKGTSARPIAGHPPPRLFPTSSGMLNAIGLENVGVDVFLQEKLPRLRQFNCPIVVNVFGFTTPDYTDVVDRLNRGDGIAAYELNISCPNTDEGGMVYGTDPAATETLTRLVKERSRRPVIVKLSPNVTDIAVLARAAESGGADALTVANTFLAMAIDTATRRPRLHNVTGGLSGPAIKPITLRMVHQCSRAVRIPIIGLGGICSGTDTVEYLLAGATAVQVGTSSFHDPQSVIRVVRELRKYMQSHGVHRVSDLTGAMETPWKEQ